MSRLSTLLICIAVPAILRWIYARSAGGKAVLDHDSIVFPESTAVPVIRWGGLVMFSAAAFASWSYGKSLLATLIFAGFAIFATFARGDSIIVDREGISGAHLGSQGGTGMERRRLARIQYRKPQHYGDREERCKDLPFGPSSRPGTLRGRSQTPNRIADEGHSACDLEAQGVLSLTSFPLLSTIS